MATVSDIHRKYGVTQYAFEKFLREETDYKAGFFGYDIPDNEVEQLVQKYKASVDPEEKRRLAEKARFEEEAKRIKAERAELARKVKSVLVNSGFSFEGYKIVKYSDSISGDSVLQVGREAKFFAPGGVRYSELVGNKLTESLKIMREEALLNLKAEAYKRGCNAIIGVDYDYITLSPETSDLSHNTVYLPYVFCVTVNGTAVLIEKK